MEAELEAAARNWGRKQQQQQQQQQQQDRCLTILCITR
jgi:hypothetical protein